METEIIDAFEFSSRFRRLRNSRKDIFKQAVISLTNKHLKSGKLVFSSFLNKEDFYQLTIDEGNVICGEISIYLVSEIKGYDYVKIHLETDSQNKWRLNCDIELDIKNFF